MTIAKIIIILTLSINHQLSIFGRKKQLRVGTPSVVYHKYFQLIDLNY
jgi:hypothetical protein